jgi:PAS domain S-box-containing protein
MAKFITGSGLSEDRSLYRRLAIIEILIFVLPFLILFYLFFEKTTSFHPSELTIITLIFILVLGGIVFLRQMFDRILNIAAILKRAESGENVPISITGDVVELEGISISLSRVMDRMEETTEKLDRKLLELTAIKELYEVARKSIDIDELLSMVLEKAMSVTGAKIGSLVVFEEGTNQYRLGMTRGLERDLQKNRYIKMEDSFIKHVVTGRKAMVIQNIEQDKRTLKTNDPRYGSPSFMSMPILIENRVAVILNLANKSTGDLFTENDMQATSVMLDEISFALENANLHAQIKEHLKEILQQNTKLEHEIAERQRIEEKLRHAQDNLESVVEKRTAELVKANEALSMEIAEHRQTEEILRKSEEKYCLHFSNVSDVIYSIGPDFTFQSVSPSALQLMGYKPEELIGRHLRECGIFSLDYSKKVMSDIMRIIGSGGITSAVYELLAKDRTKKIIEVSGTPLIQEERITAVIFVARDITERKKLESELLQARKMEAIGTLAGGIAHDFNNVLTGIQGFSSIMLLDMDASHPYYEYLKQIEECVQSASALTSQLLGFARRGKIKVEATNLGDLVRKSAAMFCRTRKDVIFDESYRDDRRMVDVDRGQIEQVLLNLFVNAAQAMPGGGKIHLATENSIIDEKDANQHTVEPGNFLKLIVADTGTGMDERTKERIFEPFFTTKEIGRGTGLGLSSVYGIIKGHGGFINVFSEMGKGTAFHIYLPISDREAPPMEKPAEEKLYKGGESILVVDDEEVILSVCRGILEKLGYRIMVAKSGQEAVERYRENQQEIDLILMDMVMPGMGGEETFDRLRSINPKVRIILSTGFSLEGKAGQLLEKGCRGFIQKPFKMNLLSQTIREVLDGPPTVPSGGT